MDICRNLVLTDDNTISNGIEEFSVSHFEKEIKENRCEFKYNKEQKTFEYSIEDCNYVLKLTSERKRLMDEGIIDPVLQRLINYADECQKYFKGKKMDRLFLQTGEYPTDLADLEAYKKYLEVAIKETKADIVKSGFSTIFVPGCAIASIASLVLAMNSNSLLSYLYLGTFAVSFAATLTSVFWVDKIPFVDFIYYVKEYLDYKDKIKKINEVGKKVVNKVEPNEVQTATKYKDLFIQEAYNVSGLIAKLPVEERKEFLIVLQDLLNDYEKEIKKISKSDDINLGAATSIWDLTSRMLPKIYRLKIDIESKVDDVISKEQVISEANQMQLSLESIKNVQSI